MTGCFFFVHTLSGKDADLHFFVKLEKDLNVYYSMYHTERQHPSTSELVLIIGWTRKIL